MATSSSSSPNAGRGADLDAFLLSIALERVTTKRLMLARAAAAAVAPRAGGGRIPNCYSRLERSQYRSVRSRMPVLSG
jgi:hypothetical protein